ncbi:cbb3-type cytochrome oxidase assembly protein CcoS [Aminobacter carboxidus]|uniref:Cbb3-type cytochrome oxidase assembly protein CcoS n=1 Tax=Aminobacter carboxidus TaxID=376165 RepID=A0ABR9GR69_9HYPH|nr:cbb3-type cytochrome oxidase assembly protein CcoS [Aminobacter carboxidus]MBE1206100.1 cbb3-type cytochrome oxidase assembly protein CcoS [Aminobacter carboxidus]
MSYLVWLVPIALGMGLVGLAAFLWSMNSGQLEDLDGAAERVLLNHGSDYPASSNAKGPTAVQGARPKLDGQHRRERA